MNKLARIILVCTIAWTIEHKVSCHASGQNTELASLDDTISSLRNFDRQMLDNQHVMFGVLKKVQAELSGKKGLLSDNSFKEIAASIDRDTLVSILEQLRRRDGVTDQKEAFMHLLLKELCRLRQDNCELRRKVRQYELLELKRIIHLEIYSRQEQLADLNREQDRYRTNKLPVDNDWRDLYPGPVPESAMQNTPIQPRLPQLRPKTFYLLQRPSVCCRNKICNNAILIAQDADGSYPNGRIDHGDIYQDCNGQQVLVRNMLKKNYSRGQRSIVIRN